MTNPRRRKTAKPASVPGQAPLPPERVTATPEPPQPHACATCGKACEPAARLCSRCQWEQSLPEVVRERKAENEAIRELAGNLIPRITSGSDKQKSWAQDIATETITRMPQRLWQVVREEAELSGAADIFSRSKFWIESRESGFYGFIMLVLIACMRRLQRQKSDEVPRRLLAIFFYVGNGRSLAACPYLDEVLQSHPVENTDLFSVFVSGNTWPLSVWGAIAAEGLRLIDPEAHAADWITKAALGPQAPVVPRCTAIPCESVGPTHPLTVALTDGRCFTITRANPLGPCAYDTDKGHIEQEQIRTCFFLLDDE